MNTTPSTYVNANAMTSSPNGDHQKQKATTASKMSRNVRGKQQNTCTNSSFKMPLHYPRYSKADYEAMPEWDLDRLLAVYGLPVSGDVEDKRKFAMGAFLWPAQLSETTK